MIRFIPVKWLVTAIALLVGLPFLALQHFGEPNPYGNFFRSVTIAVLLLTVINSLGLWRVFWWLCPGWFNRRIFPDLQGTYEGTLISNWNGGTEIPGAKLIVRQTLLHIKVKQITGESQSFSKIADIVHFDRDVNLFKLFYIYFNEPRDLVRDHSLPHVGAADLSICVRGKGISLEGRYFNDPKIRTTTGEMHFTRVSREADF
jgi:hypothetical protein